MASEMGKSAKGLLGIVSSFLRGHVRAFSCPGHGCVTKRWQELWLHHGAVRNWAGRRWEEPGASMTPSPPNLQLTQPLLIPSVSKYLLSTYCVASPVKGTGDAAENRVNMFSALLSGRGDRPQSNKHLRKCKGMAIMRAA